MFQIISIRVKYFQQLFSSWQTSSVSASSAWTGASNRMSKTWSRHVMAPAYIFYIYIYTHRQKLTGKTSMPQKCGVFSGNFKTPPAVILQAQVF